MKTRVNRSEEVRRAIIHEERSSSPPSFQIQCRAGNSPNDGRIIAELETNSRFNNPDMEKEGNG